MFETSEEFPEGPQEKLDFLVGDVRDAGAWMVMVCRANAINWSVCVCV